MESSERSLTAYKASLAEQAERYEEMVEAMKKLVMGVKEPLTKIERNLLSVAYKNVIGSKRSSLRVLITLEEKAKSKGESSNQDRIVLAEMKEQVQQEIGDVCADILQLLKNHLLPNLPDTKDQETQEEFVFYHKMEGDYHRYLAEYTTDETRSTHAKNGLMAYKEAADIAKEHLVATNPIRLGLALNFSVFYYEILDKPEKACAVAKEAFDEALPELENLPDDTYKDSTLIMQLLRDNLTLWTSDAEGKEDDLATEDIEQS